MADALLYYRTYPTPNTPWAGAPDTRAVTIPDPHNLPSGQILDFVFPNNMLEGVTKQFQKNVKKIPKANPTVNRVDKQYNGMLGSQITLRGNFKNPDSNTDLKKLETFLTQYDIDGYHIFGNLGFYSPNALRYSFDPNNNQGYTVDKFTIGRFGIRNQIYDFEFTLDFGGIYTVQP